MIYVPLLSSLHLLEPPSAQEAELYIGAVCAQAGETELTLTPPDAFQRLIAHGLVGAQPCIAVKGRQTSQ